MFDFAWSEFAVIAVVALICIGPKDMPVAIRAATGWIKKARRMAGEFQTHVDEMVREANLGEVRDQISELRNFNVPGKIGSMVDPDGSLRRTFSENPLQPAPAVPMTTETASATGAAFGELAGEATGADVAVAERPAGSPGNALPEPAWAASEQNHAVAEPSPEQPAFIPPSALPIAPPPEAAAARHGGLATSEPPAFIPPSVASRRDANAT